MTAPTVATLNIPAPGYEALAQRHVRPLSASKAFSPALVVGLDASGNVTPFLSDTVSGIQYALGILDPVQFTATFTSASGQTGPVLSGVITMANGTSGNALVQDNVGDPVYTADGLTANATSSSNPEIGGGTTTGKLCGTFLGFDSNSNPKVSVIPEINAALTGAAGTATAGVQTGATAPAFIGGSAGAAMTGTAATVASATAPAAGTAATFTVTGANYSTDQWAGALFVDHNQNLWLVLSNTNAANSVMSAVGVANNGSTFVTPASGTGTFYLPVGSVASHTHTQEA